MSTMTAPATSRRGLPVVLVNGQARPPWLEAVAARGLATVLPWRERDFDRVIETVQAAAVAARPAEIHLADREREVLRMLADGLSTLEIARRLNYSERTVKNIIHDMLDRLNLRNRPHAVAFALRHGLL